MTKLACSHPEHNLQVYKFKNIHSIASPALTHSLSIAPITGLTTTNSSLVYKKVVLNIKEVFALRVEERHASCG